MSPVSGRSDLRRLSKARRGKRNTQRHRHPQLLAIPSQTVSGAHRHCPLYAWSAIRLIARERATETAGDRAFLHSRRKIQRRKEVFSASRQLFPDSTASCEGARVRGCWCPSWHVRQLPRREGPRGKARARQRRHRVFSFVGARVFSQHDVRNACPRNSTSTRRDRSKPAHSRQQGDLCRLQKIGRGM